MSLISNIINNFEFLKMDFTGIALNLPLISNLFLRSFLSILVITIFYLIGNKIRKKLFKNNLDLITNFFIEIGLGFIVSCTGVLILGILGLFYLPILYSYFLILLVLGLFPLNSLKRRLSIFNILFKDYKNQFLKNKLVNTAILSFVIIGILKLISPEVGVDAIWYHTDYPRLYLASHTMMNVDPMGKFYPAVTPTLSDMIYVFTTSINHIDASRFIHFIFYILCILVFLLIYNKRYSFSPFAALLFATSPIVIRDAPSAYAEYYWVIFWLLAVFLLTNNTKHNLKNIILPSILIGATLAIKIWLIPFFGVIFIYLIYANYKENKVKLLKLIITYSLVSLAVPFLWYLRAFIITGNPFFPLFWNFPGESSNTLFTQFSSIVSSFSLEGIKARLSSAESVSPLSIIGLIFLFSNIKRLKKFVNENKRFVLFVILLTLVQVIINYNFHRFIIPFFSIFSILLAFGISNFVSKNKFFKLIFYFLFSGLFLYYFINALLILPYGLGLANQNKYLGRVLSRDNSSFYDYNYQFSKNIYKSDLIGTYGLWGFYYSNFNHVYTEEIFKNNQKSLKVISDKGVNKLLIQGGDMNFFCTTVKIIDCDKRKYKLITFYKFPTTASSLYLYNILK